MLFEKASAFCHESGIFKLLESASCVIVGFSGGADSGVLLSFFVSLREKFPALQIVAAHVNHMIRGSEADRDEDFCRELCKELGVELFVNRTDVPALSRERGTGIEETARDVRYEFFAGLSEQYEGALIATAHNANDNLETLLFNICRGSGVRGMGGISPVRGNCIRPLLCCSSEEIRDFAKKSGICFVTDSTNADSAYTRNAIRLGVVPVLTQINPKAAKAALRLSAHAREDSDYLESVAENFLSSAEVSRREMSRLHPAIFSRVVALMFERASGGRRDLSEKNVRDCRIVVEASEKKSISLPGGFAFIGNGDIVFVAKEKREKTEKSTERYHLEKGKPLMFGSFGIFVSEKDEYAVIIEENVYNLSLHGCIDCDKISGELYVRCRRPGDTLRTGKMNKKLKKLLCDCGVPACLRDSLPVFEDDEGIIYVPYVGIRDGCGACESTRNALSINITERRF